MKIPFLLFALAALTVFCATQLWTIASASSSGNQSLLNKGGNEDDSVGGGGYLKLSDIFPILGNNDIQTTDFNNDKSVIGERKINNFQFPSGSLSSFLQNLQQTLTLSSQTTALNSSKGSSKERSTSNEETPNRRKVLYELSVRSHYARLLHEHENTYSSVPSVDVAFDDCEYYNDGMQSSFDARDNYMGRSEEKEGISGSSILSRFSHWTFRFCPKISLSQIHLEPIAITDHWDAKLHNANNDAEEILKLPPNSVLSDKIQFLLPTVIDLGMYLSPLSPEYESYISTVWGHDEATSLIRSDSIEYYVGGDACTGSMERHSKVIYDQECCHRNNHRVMEEFFQNHGKVMIRSAEEPKPCRYILRACKICSLHGEENATETLDISAEEPIHSIDPSDIRHLLQSLLQGNPLGDDDTFPPMPPSQIEGNKQLLRSMFTHAYDSYFYNAFPASELKPLTCSPGVFDLVRVPALTLIDTLDTFIILGNYTEFARSVERLRYLDEKMKREFQLSQEGGAGGARKRKNGLREGEAGGLFSVDQNVSVFETTIRVLGGLLSAHQMALAFMTNRVSKSDVWDSSGDILNSTDAGMVVGHDDSHACVLESLDCPTTRRRANENDNERDIASPPWEYDGFLLVLAHDVGKRLVHAFDTETGIPYGTVNLLNGVPRGETSVASLAGAGSLSLEFELLSRLTGDRSFGEAAKSATRALWSRRSPQLDLLGKHIDVHSGEWTEIVSGVGSNSDSFYEYLIKHYLLFPEDSDFWKMFTVAYAGVQQHSRVGGWYVDVGMSQGLTGHVRNVFESLMAFFPGLQVLLGEMVPSARTANAFFSVRELLGLLPERFDFIRWRTEDSGNIHPLRPELLESSYFLHLASIGLHGSTRGPCCNANSSHSTSSWLWAADFALRAVNQLSWTPCGFATVANVGPTTTGSVVTDPQTFQPLYKARHQNEMPSYFLSETIKYLFLTFDADNNVLHNDNEREWIFTTEAHPIHFVESVAVGDNRLDTQLDQVRTLLKEIVSNSSLPIVDNGFSVGKTMPQNESTITHEEKSDVFLESGPALRKELISAADTASFGILSSEVLAINQARSQFDHLGMEGLRKQCPNYHHPDLQWTHALHGDSLDYSTREYRSMLSLDQSPKADIDERMLTALFSTCFYGTDFYANGIVGDSDLSCPVSDTQDDNENAKMNRSQSDIIPGATRYDMGGSLGAFDVSIFPAGDGFVVMHLDSQALLEVSLFHNYPKPGIEGRLALVVLTVPPTRQQYSTFVKRYLGDKIELFGRSLNGSWGRLSRSGVVNYSIEDDSEPNLVGNEYHRHVVVADMETNSFTCEVVITKKEAKALNSEVRDLYISKFPCSPAMFGKASVSNLRQQHGGEVVQGLLVPPPVGDEIGCESPHDVQQVDQRQRFRQLEDEFVHDERRFVQIIYRGDCSFMEKVENHRHAQGVIVINSNPNELFIMSGDGRSEDDLPVSVLVSGNDGASMVEILHDEQSMGNEVKVQIQLTKDSYDLVKLPRVHGSKDALQVTASKNWGVQAVSRGNKAGHNELQLFIIQPTVDVNVGG